MSVDFKMGCQDDQDDNVHQNLRTVSMWSKYGFVVNDEMMEAGFGWVNMVFSFASKVLLQSIYGLDISPTSEFAKTIQTFLDSPFNLHNYEICKQLLTQHNFKPTQFGNDYGPIRYGIYDLCGMYLDSESFIQNLYDIQKKDPDFNSDFTLERVTDLVSLARILRKAVIKHIVAYKQCSHYKIANQMAYMHQIPGQASVQQDQLKANMLYWIPATVANEYEDKKSQQENVHQFSIIITSTTRQSCFV